MPMLTTPLPTPRLILRAPIPDDLDDVHAYQTLPEVTRYLYRPPRSSAQCAAMIADARAAQWEVRWILHPRHTGRGYAAEAAAAVVAAAFDRLGAHRVFARLDVENTASVRLGMRREAHLVENDLDQDGRWGSEYVYAALARDLRRRDDPSAGLQT